MRASLKEEDESSLKDTDSNEDENDKIKSWSLVPKGRDEGLTQHKMPKRDALPLNENIKKLKTAKVKTKKKKETTDHSVYSHHFNNILWWPEMPIVSSVKKEKKETSVSQDVYDEWPLYNNYIIITKNNVSLNNICLCDWVIWKIIEAKIAEKTREAS